MNIHLTTFILVTAFALGTAVGQKGEQDSGPVGIFESPAEYNQFMRGLKIAAYGEGGNQELRNMIPMLNDMVLGQDFGTTAKQYGNNNSSTFDLLSDPKVREDINMVDDQYKDLQRMNKEIHQRAGKEIRAIDFSDRENIAKQVGEIRDRAQKDLNDVLLPHQLQRLRQLRAQVQLRYRSLVDLITSEPLKNDLEISDDQSVELKQAEKEIEEELAEEIAKLRENARQRLLSKLKPNQKEQVEDMIGQYFEFRNDQNKVNKLAKPKRRK